nr:hypothetical protein [Algoriphagus sp. Y33]
MFQVKNMRLIHVPRTKDAFAIKRKRSWLLHAGDAYYLRWELSNPHHPVIKMAASIANNNLQREKP